MPALVTQIELYRLIKVDNSNLFTFEGKAIENDSDIRRVLEHSARADFDILRNSNRSRFKWALREFVEFAGSESATIWGATIARSVLETGWSDRDRSEGSGCNHVDEPTTGHYEPPDLHHGSTPCGGGVWKCSDGLRLLENRRRNCGTV